MLNMYQIALYSSCCCNLFSFVQVLPRVPTDMERVKRWRKCPIMPRLLREEIWASARSSLRYLPPLASDEAAVCL